MSDTSPIHCGVTQGSVLGPVLYFMYTMPLEHIIHHHGLQYMMYVDDIQLYITCNGDQVPTGTIEECVGDTRHRMRTNMLAMNDRQIEVIHFPSKFHGPSCDPHVGGVSISPTNATCNLGVMTDSAGTTSNHISRLFKFA